MPSPITHYLKDYQKPHYSIHQTHLEFDIHDEYTQVTNTMHVYREPNTPDNAPLVLNGEQQELISVSLNGAPLTPNHYQRNDEHLTLQNLPTDFTLTIVSRLNPAANTALEGLYRSGDMLCTQCESHGFRKITYYIDRPDVMSLFTTKIIADKTHYPQLLSNGNKVAQGDLTHNRHYVIWQDPFKKPCYLFALVAGDLAMREGSFTTQSGRHVALHIFTRHPDYDKSIYAIEALQDSMRWDEKVYGREYDLDVYMIVAVGDFNMGAMENKGLNVFNTKYVLASDKTATDSDYRQIQAVIGHEYFHNWTGNRVTCRDWFQLSLKEGLTVFRDQQFTADHHSATVKRIDDVKTIRSAQFTEDASPMAHPIRPASYIQMNNFYTVTVYNKGAEVIRMMHTLVGVSGFRKGMDLYFQRHDGQAVTCDDYVAAIADANQIDLSQFKRWYSQAGTPTITAEDHYDATSKIYTLMLSQSCAPSADGSAKEPFYIPVKLGLIGASGKDLTAEYSGKAASEFVIILKEPKQTFIFEHVLEHPTPSLLRDFSAPVKLIYPYTEQQLQHLFSHDTNEFNRWDAGQKLATQLILKMTDALHQQQPLPDTYAFIQGLRHTLNNTNLDPALIAEAISLPSESMLIQDMVTIWPDELHHARVTLATDIATQLKDDLLKTYHRFHHQGVYQRDQKHIVQRHLKNTCLAYLLRLQDADITALLQQQFTNANNMTDQIAALSALVNSHDAAARTQALNKFYQQYQKDALVVDKWLVLQSTADLPSTLNNVQQLIKHSAYHASNPNKVYSLIGGFAANHHHFHQKDGAGYHWLAQQVIILDKNPQVAARIVRSLINFKRYDIHRQALMKQALQQILAAPGLSKDVYEIVSKSLSS